MLATTVPFQTMIEGRSQVIGYSVTIDLPTDALYPGGSLFPGGGLTPGGAASNDVSLAVTALEIDASIDTDMPEGTRLEEGFSAAQGTFTLAGTVDPTDSTKTAAWLFGRYSTTSPLYRIDVLYRRVTIELGLFPEGSYGTPELLVKLEGLVEDYGLDSNGNVSFTVFDLRQQFRGDAGLPAVVTVPPFNAGLTNEFVVDRLLRSATAGAVSSWPAQRPQCVLAVGFRSSLWPEVGTLLSAFPAPADDFALGVFGTAFAFDGGNAEYTLDQPPTYSEFLLNGFGALTTLNFQMGNVELIISATLVRASIFASTVGIWFGTIDSAPHWIGFLMTGSGGTYNGTLYFDGTPHTLFTGQSVALGDGVAVSGFGGNGTVEALQATTETTPTPTTAFTPRAVLDPSLNPLDVVPGVTGDPWAAIQQLAASELAVAGFEGDTFYYRNRQTLRTSPSVRTITSEQALNEIAESSSSAAIVNRAQIGWTPWTFADTATTLWSAPKAHKVPAHGTWSTTVTLPSLAAQIDEVASLLADSSTDVANSHFRASIDKVGTAPASGITVTAEQVAGDKVTVTATNSTNSAAWLVSPSTYTDMPPGTPLLRVAGLAVTAGDEQTTDYQWPLPADGGASSSRFGEILYQLTGNPWLQDEDTAQALAQDIVASGYVSRADLLRVDIVPDPRLQRCDRVRIVDTARTGVDAYALIFGYQISYQAPSEPGGAPTFSMSIDARTITAPGGWLLGVIGHSELGSTTYLPGSAA